MEAHWKLIRAGLLLAIVAFVAAGVAGALEEPLGWSDDPRWSAVIAGGVLTLVALVGSVIGKLVAAAHDRPSHFPTRLLLLTLAVAILVPLVHLLLHLDDIGPMGVV